MRRRDRPPGALLVAARSLSAWKPRAAAAFLLKLERARSESPVSVAPPSIPECRDVRSRGRKGRMAEQWSLKGSILGDCNCDWGCPCNFNVAPTHGHCDGVYTWVV